MDLERIEINLDGISTEIQIKNIPINLIILDIENPRIQYFLDTRLNDESMSQGNIKFALSTSNDQYDKLKEHIERNGGIYDPIWVVPQNEYYVVIEGNTRAYIYEELSEKYINENKWKEIRACVLPHKVNKNIINFIRLEKHLFGETPWAAYEKARELFRLHTQEDYSLQRLEKLTKLRTSEIENSIQAFQDMDSQYLPKYNKPNDRQKFSYFVEFRKNKELKKLVKTGKLSLMEFCEWVGEGKFDKGEQVRSLALVLNDDSAKQELINDNFKAALDQLEQKNPAAKSKLFSKIEEIIEGLGKINFAELDELRSGLQPAKVSSLEKLHGITEKILKDIGNKK